MARRHRPDHSGGYFDRLYRQAEREQTQRAERGVAEVGYGWRGRHMRVVGTVLVAAGLLAGAIILVTTFM